MSDRDAPQLRGDAAWRAQKAEIEIGRAHV